MTKGKAQVGRRLERPLYDPSRPDGDTRADSDNLARRLGQGLADRLMRGFGIVPRDTKPYVITTDRGRVWKRNLTSEEAEAFRGKKGYTVEDRTAWDVRSGRVDLVDDHEDRIEAGMRGSKVSQARGRWDGKKLYRTPTAEWSGGQQGPYRDAKGRKGSFFTHKVIEQIPGIRASRIRVPRED